MILSQNDYYEYLNTHLNLLFFVGYNTGILSKQAEFGDFLRMRLEVKAECRDAFLENQDVLLEEYIGERNKILNEQLPILDDFRKNIHGRFIFLKNLSKHAIFKSVDNSKFYAVKALKDSFVELVPDYPALVELNILPFKGQFIYDGFIKGKNIKIDTMVQKTLHKEYIEAKKENKIMVSLD